MSLKNKNSDLGPKKIDPSNPNLKNTIETKFNTSAFSNLKYIKYDPTSTQSLGGSTNILSRSIPAPDLPAPDNSIGAFSNAFSSAFNV
jgi:hypothetical protein